MPKYDIIGMKELERAFKQLGKVPQTAATSSARAAGRIALKAAKANAPVDTGQLKQGIIMKKERKTVAGKAVYDITMDPAMNDVFAKTAAYSRRAPTKKQLRQGITQGDLKRSYYPASQEYGFLTRNGGYVPGYHFLKRALTEHDAEIEKKVLETAGKAVDKALRG